LFGNNRLKRTRFIYQSGFFIFHPFIIPLFPSLPFHNWAWLSEHTAILTLFCCADISLIIETKEKLTGILPSYPLAQLMLINRRDKMQPEIIRIREKFIKN